MAVVELVEKPAEANLSEQIDAIACKLYLFADRVECLADTIPEIMADAHLSDLAGTSLPGELKRAIILADMLVDVGKEAGPVGEQLEEIATKMKGGPAKGAPPPAYGDAAIIEAWEKRQVTLAEMRRLPPEDTEEPIEIESERDRLLSIMDEAEEAIRSQVATTPRGVSVQLLAALGSSLGGIEEEAAVTRGDIAWLTASEQCMSWNERLIVAALCSLQAMEESSSPSGSGAGGRGEKP